MIRRQSENTQATMSEPRQPTRFVINQHDPTHQNPNDNRPTLSHWFANPEKQTLLTNGDMSHDTIG